MDYIHRHRTLFVLEGIAITILGMLAIALPVIFSIGFAILLGFIFIGASIFQAIRLFQATGVPGVIYSLITLLLYLILGILLIAYPIKGVVTLTLFLTAFFILEGIAKIIWGLKLRPLQGWGWLIFSGIVALLMAAIIIAGWPTTALWVIGLLVGIDLVFYGISLITLAASHSRPEV